MENYSQYIRDTKKAWAKMPKTQLLNEEISLTKACALVTCEDVDKSTRQQNLFDLHDWYVVYLQDGTCLKKIEDELVKHWQ